MRSLTATVTRSVGLAVAGASLAPMANSVIPQAIARLLKLEQELRPLVQSLIQQASTAADIPAPSRPAQLETPGTTQTVLASMSIDTPGSADATDSTDSPEVSSGPGSAPIPADVKAGTSTLEA